MSYKVTRLSPVQILALCAVFGLLGLRIGWEWHKTWRGEARVDCEIPIYPGQEMRLGVRTMDGGITMEEGDRICLDGPRCLDVVVQLDDGGWRLSTWAR